ncbi:hypothetical protein SDC9_195629 [bioreactor metagenome]|uniref:Uncharacterized protein n=1 Tax=bioreactor metagenome TaxID=1076179 RepID=A0A645I9K0_9ZZZZ
MVAVTDDLTVRIYLRSVTLSPFTIPAFINMFDCEASSDNGSKPGATVETEKALCIGRGQHCPPGQNHSAGGRRHNEEERGPPGGRFAANGGLLDQGVP